MYQVPFGAPDLASNPERRCPCLLLLDTSTSMRGSRITQLNTGIHSFMQSLRADPIKMQRVEIGAVTFGPIQTHDFHTADQFNPPLLQASGDTPMGEAIMTGLDMLEARKAQYKQAGVSYYRPWVWLITDGGPTDPWQQAAARVHDGDSDARKSFLFFAVGVQGADTQTLSQICSPGRPPVQLEGLNFAEMFEWLSSSLGNVARSKPDEKVALPRLGWAEV